MQPNLSLALNLPPEGALRYFDSLNLPLPANAGEAIAQTAAKARSIAGIYQQEIVGDLLNSLRQSAAEGTPFATWRKNALAMLRERGLALDKAGDMVQQSTGEVVGTGLTRHRLQTIFQTQMTNARMASLWQKLQENKDARPYLQYSAINDARTRPAHRALDNVVYPIDDPFWDYFYPPNGFRCRCHVIALAPRDVARAGLTVSHSSPEQFSEMVITNRKGQSHTRTRITLADGRSFTPDKGFDNNVGKNHLAQLGQLQMERAVDLPPRLASMAAGEALKDPAFSQAIAQQFRERFDYLQNHFGSNQMLHIGVLSPSVLDALDKRGLMPQSAVISMGDADITHAMREGKIARGQALPDDVLREIPTLLQNPDAVYLQTNKNKPVLWFVYETEKGKLVLLLDRADKKSQRKMNIVITGGKIFSWNASLKQHELIWGKTLED
nr:MAG TPA: minor capsid component [Caudoviricetes sp.]DAS41248.1 MAG TPA: minor capsid component [Caudoviricetes sp.]